MKKKFTEEQIIGMLKEAKRAAEEMREEAELDKPALKDLLGRKW